MDASFSLRDDYFAQSHYRHKVNDVNMRIDSRKDQTVREKVENNVQAFRA
jgi:hypothetical protein